MANRKQTHTQKRLRLLDIKEDRTDGLSIRAVRKNGRRTVPVDICISAERMSVSTDGREVVSMRGGITGIACRRYKPAAWKRMAVVCVAFAAAAFAVPRELIPWTVFAGGLAAMAVYYMREEKTAVEIESPGGNGMILEFIYDETTDRRLRDAIGKIKIGGIR